MRAALLLFVVSLWAADAPNVTGISAAHRNGQTFITWTDPATGASGQNLRYRLYRSTAGAITDTATATLVQDGVGIYNNNGQLQTGVVNAANRIDAAQPGAKIQAGGTALATWTGLAVYTAQASESAYYAVITYEPSGSTYATPSPIVAGQNATAGPVSETVADIQPVLQRADSFGWAWDNASGHPLMLSLHASSSTSPFPYGSAGGWSTIGDLYAYWGDGTMSYQDGMQGVFDVYQDSAVTPKRMVLSPRDTVYNQAGTAALETMWFGLATTPLGGSAPNRAYNHTENRLALIVPWVAAQYQVDTHRVYSTGGSMGAWGSVSWAFHHPEIFAAVFPDRPRWKQVTIADTTLATNETATSTVPMMADGTTSYLSRQDTVTWIGTQTNLPPVAWGIGKQDGFATWQEHLDAIAALKAGKHWFAVAWDNGNHSTTVFNTVKTQYANTSVFARNLSRPAFFNFSLDGDLAADSGCINCGWTWSVASDTATTWSATVSNSQITTTATADIVPRNVQAFSPGSSATWSTTGGQTGTATADANGLVTAEGVTIPADGIAITFTAGTVATGARGSFSMTGGRMK